MSAVDQVLKKCPRAGHLRLCLGRLEAARESARRAGDAVWSPAFRARYRALELEVAELERKVLAEIDLALKTPEHELRPPTDN